MQFDLKEQLSPYLNRQLSDTLAQQSGQDTNVLERAIHYAVVLTAVQLIGKIQQPKSAKALYIFSRVASGTKLNHALPHLFNDSEHYRGILNMGSILYGDKFKSLSQWLSKETGLSEAYASATIKMVTPVVLAVCGEKIKTRRLALDGYVDFLNLQKEKVLVMANEIPLFPFYLLSHSSEKNKGSSGRRRSSSSSKKSSSKPWYLSWKMKWSMMIVFTGIALLYIIIK
jgi:hypothetical protein